MKLGDFISPRGGVPKYLDKTIVFFVLKIRLFLMFMFIRKEKYILFFLLFRSEIIKFI